MRWMQRIDDRLSDFAATTAGRIAVLLVIAAVVALAIWCPLPTAPSSQP